MLKQERYDQARSVAELAAISHFPQDIKLRWAARHGSVGELAEEIGNYPVPRQEVFYQHYTGPLGLHLAGHELLVPYLARANGYLIEGATDEDTYDADLTPPGLTIGAYHPNQAGGELLDKLRVPVFPMYEHLALENGLSQDMEIAAELGWAAALSPRIPEDNPTQGQIFVKQVINMFRDAALMEGSGEGFINNLLFLLPNIFEYEEIRMALSQGRTVSQGAMTMILAETLIREYPKGSKRLPIREKFTFLRKSLLRPNEMPFVHKLDEKLPR